MQLYNHAIIQDLKNGSVGELRPSYENRDSHMLPGVKWLQLLHRTLLRLFLNYVGIVFLNLYEMSV